MSTEDEGMKGKKILLGITGSIAAFRALEVVRQLVKKKAEVRCILTRNGAQFVTVVSLETLSGNPVATDMFEKRTTPRIEHIELALWPDLVVVAPATANFLAKLASGLADDLLSTTMLALKPDVPVVLAPAMNTRMWSYPAVKRNLCTIEGDLGDRLTVVGPQIKDLACGEEGMGAMAEPVEIIAAVEKTLLRF